MKIRSEMKREKEQYINKMCEMLRIDPRSEVKDVKYEVYEQWDYYEEYVIILFNSGFSKKINVTGNSDYGILDTVARAVYA
jgi:hypothetical protein